MRRPFVLFLVLITLYFWLKDVTGIYFYLIGKKGAEVNIYSNVISPILFVAILYTIKITVFKKTTLPSFRDIFQPERKKEWLLLFLVALPIIALGLFRSIYPDQNFDTFHYELYLQDFFFHENKTNFNPGGKASYLFPLSERVFGFFRHLLGYRLGTILNTLLIVTIIVSSYDFIKKFLVVYAPELKIRNVFPALFALFVVFADNTLFNIGSYKTDLIGIPLLLELMHLIFFGSQYSKKITYIFFFVLASIIIALKLTFIPFTGILGLIFFIKNYKSISPVFLFAVPLLVLLFPGIYILYNAIDTGNPIFPYFNKFFKSPWFPQENIKDTRWGPRNMTEKLCFHITTLLNNSRSNEWSLFSYRFLIGFFTSLGVTIFYFLRLKSNKHNSFYTQLTLLCLIALMADYSWAITTGYSRYGIFMEVLYWLALTLLLTYVKKRFLNVLLTAAILFQFSVTFQNIFVKQMNLSWFNYRELLHNSKLRQENARLILHDYGQITDNSNILPKIDAFITVDPGITDGLAKLLNKNAAIYDLSLNRTKDSIIKFENDVIRVQSQQKNFVTLNQSEYLGADWMSIINKRGYLATDMYEVYPDFLRANEPVILFKVKYLDTSKYTINTILKYVTVGSTSPSDSIFTYQSNQKRRIFIREAPYAFSWPLNVYDLFINDKIYTINSKSKNNKIFTLDSNVISIRANQPKTLLIIIQEVEEKSIHKSSD
jgi:hypothetical protein